MNTITIASVRRANDRIIREKLNNITVNADSATVKYASFSGEREFSISRDCVRQASREALKKLTVIASPNNNKYV